MAQAPAPKRLFVLTLLMSLSILLTHMGGFSLSFYAGAEAEEDTPHPPSIVNLTSVYMNEKGAVKAYHRDIIFTFNSWTNQSKSFLIMRDGDIVGEGNFTYHRVVVITFRVKIVRELKVYIDDNLSLQRRNMIIYNRQYYDSPDADGGGTFLGYTLSFIEEQKWAIFRASTVGALIGIMFLGKIIQYYYRKRMGEEVIVSSI